MTVDARPSSRRTARIGLRSSPGSPLLQRIAGDRAAERVTRVLAFGFLPGGVVFGLLVGPVIADQASLWPALWTCLAFVALVGPPVVFGALSFLVTLRVLRGLAAVATAGSLLVLGTAPLVLLRPHVITGPAWIDQIAALGLIAAVLAMPAGWAVAVAVLGSLLTLLLRLATDVSGPIDAVQNGAYVLLFTVTFIALGASSLAAARRADRAEDAAMAAATDAAVDAAREREQARINALVHDRVLATLLTAGRRLPGAEDVGRQDAQRALDGLTGLLADDPPAPEALDGQTVVWRVQGVTTEFAPEAVFGWDVAARRTVPAPVVEALLTATEEALRNSLRHAGPANCTVHVRMDDTVVEVQVIDDGVGFDPAAVPPTRLGISRSIEGRMRALDGGGAQVISTPGVGTRVVLEWTGR